MTPRIVFAALLLAASGSASAGLAEAMARCKSITDAEARTACYDAISLATPEPPPPPAAPPPPVAPAAAEAPSSPEEIHGKVAGEIGGWKLGTVIALQDGSRWKVVADDRTGFKLRNSPEVTIKKSFFSWWLTVDGTGFRTKVQKIEP